jgi:hypothetical protein
MWREVAGAIILGRFVWRLGGSSFFAFEPRLDRAVPAAFFFWHQTAGVRGRAGVNACFFFFNGVAPGDLRPGFTHKHICGNPD